MSTSTERMRRLRERRAAALVPIDGQAPRPADELLLPAVNESLNAAGLDDSGAGAAALARQYARVIDRASDQRWALRWIGPLLLESLKSLHLTPATRAAARPADRPPSRLDALREARGPGKRP
jgi:hypothetical protein